MSFLGGDDSGSILEIMGKGFVEEAPKINQSSDRGWTRLELKLNMVQNDTGLYEYCLAMFALEINFVHVLWSIPR